MSARTHHFRIGLFVLFGAFLVIGALFAMGLRSYFGRRVVFETCVTGKVENLSAGALVKLRGVTIGKITSIGFIGSEYPRYKEQYVLIRFEVPKDFAWCAQTNIQEMLDAQVMRGLRARVESQGFLGANILALEYVDPALYPVEPIPWTPRHYYIPSAPSQFNRVMASLEKTLRHVEDVQVTNLLEQAQQMIDGLNHLAENANRVDFQQLGTNANSLVVEFRQTNRRLQGTLADAQKAINGVDLPAVGRDTAALETRVSSAVLELHRQLANVDTGELNNALANVRAATDELVVLLHKLEERPSSVVFGKSPQPAPEMNKPPKP